MKKIASQMVVGRIVGYYQPSVFSRLSRWLGPASYRSGFVACPD
jgi:hypothetical protein